MKQYKYLVVFAVIMVIISSLFVIYFDKIRNTVRDIPYPTKAFYDFEDDEIGSFPAGFRGQGFNGSQVIKLENNELFNKVAEIKNNDNRRVELYTRYKRATKAILEFDYYGTVYAPSRIDISQINEDYDPIDDICIKLGDADTHAITVKLSKYNWKRISAFSINVWYHFKIQFTMNSWRVWISRGDQLIYSGDLEEFEYEQIPAYFCHLYWTIWSGNLIYVDNVRITVTEII